MWVRRVSFFSSCTLSAIQFSPSLSRCNETSNTPKHPWSVCSSAWLMPEIIKEIQNQRLAFYLYWITRSPWKSIFQVGNQPKGRKKGKKQEWHRDLCQNCLCNTVSYIRLSMTKIKKWVYLGVLDVILNFNTPWKQICGSSEGKSLFWSFEQNLTNRVHESVLYLITDDVSMW